MSITKHDLKALRNADALVFHDNVEHHGESGDWLKAVQDARNSSTGYDQDHWVQLADSRIIRYEGGMGNGAADYPTKDLPAERIGASVVLLNPKTSMEVQTWLKVLREGDELSVEFLAGNNNDVMRKAGLSMDEAYLFVHRPRTATHSVPVGKFHLESRVTEVWSSARMVHPVQPHRLVG
jgi:hypothetical protein